MNELLDLHMKEYGTSPSVAVHLPGVYTIVGEYANFCSGYSIYASSTRMLYTTCSRRKDQSVRAFLSPLEERKRVNLLNLKYRREDRWANYIKGVLSIFNLRGYQPKGFSISFSGDVLTHESQTLRCSMALSVALACNELFDFGLSYEDCAHIAYTAITQFVGEPARIGRFLAMLNARDNTYLFFDVQHLSIEYIPIEQDSSVATLLIESKISPQAFKEEAELRRVECTQAFEAIAETLPRKNLRDLESDEEKELTENLGEDEKRLVSYVLSESKLALEAKNYLTQHLYPQYGKVLSRIQVGLRDGFEISCPEIDWLTKRSSETMQSYGAVMIAGGDVGSLIVLIEEDAISSYAERMEEYEHIFGFRPEVKRFFPRGELKIVRLMHEDTSDE